ncbi:helical backbone metal receptor [Winogradskyella sp. 3972H.M.0a.05]|uniref:ABC transporter substrate-binding protein n=1 Tax=Winogradskyella sp. 3972H.M.0a.05 TaxID=2950277 RepID=UPI00339424DC
MEYSDQLQRKLHFKDKPKRIVSLVPSLTELLVDLGLEDKIVGVTKFCINPKHLRKEKTVVGGTKQVHIYKIKALNPDIILCNKEENTLAIVESCEQIAQTHVSDIYTVEDCHELITMYADLFDCSDKAKLISDTIKQEQKDFEKFISNKQSIQTAYFIWKNPWMVAGKDTFINYLLSLNKFQNYYENLDRYPEVDLDSNKNENVELVLLSSEPYPFKEIHKEELKKYYSNAKVLLVDGEAFSWYGSRLTKAFKYFKKLHQELVS